MGAKQVSSRVPSREHAFRRGPPARSGPQRSVAQVGRRAGSPHPTQARGLAGAPAPRVGVRTRCAEEAALADRDPRGCRGGPWSRRGAATRASSLGRGAGGALRLQPGL